jgi:hypothetical protein
MDAVLSPASSIFRRESRLFISPASSLTSPTATENTSTYINRVEYYTYGYLGSTKEISNRYCFRSSVADPNPGSGKDKKSGSGSEMNNPDHISESLEIIFLGLKY